MVASTDIKFYVRSNNNAPQLQNAYGSMIGVLDACLVNGISLGPVSTLTAVGTMATAVFSIAHNLMQYQVLKIAGANQAEYNGEHRILTVPNATSVTFELGSAPSVTSATGSINASLPSLGWEKPFSSVNANGGGKAAYRSKNLLLPSRPFLRVVDELDPAYTANYAKYAKVGIVEDMVDIDTMLGVQAPYNSNNPSTNWVGFGSGSSAVNGWAKWYYARCMEAHDSSGSDVVPPGDHNRAWLLVGGADYFYIMPSPYYSGSAFPFGFGNFESYLNVDTSNTFLAAVFASSAANATSTAHFNIPIGKISPTESQLILSRGYTQAAAYKSATCLSMQVSTGNVFSGASNYIGAYNLNNLAPFTPILINENVLRGELPKIYFLYQQRPYSNLQLIEKDGAIYVAVNIGTTVGIGQIVLKVGDL